MTIYVLLFLIAALVGAAAALQAQFMGQMGQAIGTFESVFITYGIGGGIIAVIALVMRGGNLGAWRTVPPYTLSSGLLGLAIVGGLAYLAPRIGLVATFTVVVTAQFVVGAAVDHFGLFNATVRALDASRAGGIGLLLVGLWLIVR